MLPTFSPVQDNLRASMEALELLRQNADYVSSKLEVKAGLKRKLAAVKIAIGKESSDRLITRLNESVTLLGLALTAWNIHDAKLNKIYTPSKFGRFAMAYATTTALLEKAHRPGEECDYGDEYIRIFQQRFLPNFYNGPLIHRLEAFRLGSFHCQTSTTLSSLIARDKKITSFDVSESSRTGVSLMHSAAVAFGIRFADEVLPWVRGWAMWNLSPFNKGWSHLVLEVASVARQEDLHTVETVQPWDVYQVPTWKGTPLISVIGGALCYLSPDIEFFRWDKVFQSCIQKWVSILQESGVDLMLYGEQESINISKYFRAAFDSDAIEASRNEIRNVLPSSSAELTFRRAERSDRKMWNNNHWIPIRLLELKFGPTPSEWEIVWVPEFEWMANEFWQMMEKETIIMPGSWIDE
uniref:Uncharacterized protein n=1 Tax=Fusarium oxysporum (strain Fo5176) TaxID=660025 RepID=A0A0D2XAK1_FUSOF